MVHRQQSSHGPLLDNGIVIKTHSLCNECFSKDLDGKFNEPVNLKLCLNPSPGSFADRISCASPQNGRGKRQRQHRPECCSDLKPYHRAIVLIRHPLDVVKSNFHFRLTSLGMDSVFDYDFVTDRISAWIQLYKRLCCMTNFAGCLR